MWKRTSYIRGASFFFFFLSSFPRGFIFILFFFRYRLRWCGFCQCFRSLCALRSSSGDPPRWKGGRRKKEGAKRAEECAQFFNSTIHQSAPGFLPLSHFPPFCLRFRTDRERKNTGKVKNPRPLIMHRWTPTEWTYCVTSHSRAKCSREALVSFNIFQAKLKVCSTGLRIGIDPPHTGLRWLY